MQQIVGLAAALAITVVGFPPLESTGAAASGGEGIAVVNPVRVGPTPVIASKEIPGRGGSTYPFVVWWSGLDPDKNYLADLTIEGPGGSQGIGRWDPEGRSGEGSVPWQVPPDWPSGIYVLSVVLQRFDDTVFWHEVAADSFDVLLDADANRTSAAVGPQGSGFFKHKGESLQSDVQALASSGTQRVRFFYSTSSRGTTPAWRYCEASRVEEGSDSAHGFCLLRDDDTPWEVKWVAAVANDTPSDAAVDQSFDAASSVVDPQAYRARPRIFLEARGSTGSEACLSFVVHLLGHRGDSLIRADVDLHANRSRFATTGSQSELSVPDNGPHRTSNAPPCDSHLTEGRQGRHSDEGPFHLEGVTQDADPVEAGALVTSGWRISVWFDFDRDDVKDRGEPHDDLFFGEDTRPSLRTEKARVKRGRKVLLYGSFDGTHCSESRRVALKRRVGSRPWKTVEQVVSSSYASYSFEPRVRRRTRFKVVSSQSESCSRAASRVVTVRIKR